MPMPSNQKQTEFHIWEGVYESFQEAKSNLDIAPHTFDQNPKWRQRLHEKLMHELQNYYHEGLPPKTIRFDYPLDIILAMMLANQSHLKILDFGGGLGLQFIQAMTNIQLNMSQVEYHIVELPQVTELGKKTLSEFKQIQFSEALPAQQKMDLVHLGSALQYIEEWQDLLKSLSQYQPEYMILSDVLAGECPSFVTTQYYYGERIPVWFLNIDELIQHLSRCGYALIYATKHYANVLGQTGPLPTQNLPHNNQLDATCHFVLKKKSQL